MGMEGKERVVYVSIVFSMVSMATVAAMAIFLFAPQIAQDGVIRYESEGDTYVLYIGTNDRETYTQLIPTADAQAIVNDIFARHIGAYTAQIAQGAWTDKTGALTQELTLIYTISGAEESQIVAAMDEIIEKLNQNSVMIEKASRQTAFYGRE